MFLTDLTKITALVENLEIAIAYLLSYCTSIKKMPSFKSAEKLADICVASVANNMDNLWCADYRENFAKHKLKYVIGPFHYLNSKCLNKIMTALRARKSLKKMHLQLLITPFLTDLDLSGASKYVTNEFVDLAIERCDCLNSVSLESCSRISSYKMIQLIERFGCQLTKINLCHTKFDDSVLQALGQHCTNLLVLDISATKPKLTKDGLTKLFVSPADTNQLTAIARTIKALHMVWMEIILEDAVPFLVNILLTWCTQIKTLDHGCLWEAVIQACRQTNYTHKFALTGLVYQFPIPMMDFKEPIDFAKVMQCLPEFKHLATQYMNMPMGIEIFDIFISRGSNLMSISLDWNAPFSYIEYIGKECPHLVTMQLYIKDVGEPAYEVRDAFEAHQTGHQLNHVPWSKLAIMSLQFEFLTVPGSVLDVLKRIFAGSRRTLVEARINAMPNPGINQLIVDALHLGYFSALRHLDVSDSHAVTPDTVWELIFHQGHLAKITFMDCNDVHLSHYLDMFDYVYDHNLNVKLVYDHRCISDYDST